MITVLVLCGIVLVICAYHKSEIIKTGDLLDNSSVFTSFISHTSKSNNFIPTPASAFTNIHIPYPNPVRYGTHWDDPVFSPVKDTAETGYSGCRPALPVIYDHSLLVHKLRKRSKAKRSV